MNRIAIVAVPLAAFLGLAVSAAIVAGRVPPRQAAAMEQEPISLPDVLLTDHHNREAALVSQIAGDDLLVITFNYTTCESVCGVGNAIMQKLDKTVASRMKRPVRLLSITINPTVDTPGILAEAAWKWGPSERWLWTTGRPGDIEKILRQANARTADIELHELVFIVGDAKQKDFRRVPVNDATVSGVVAALDEYDR
ncbi:SCO family protein [Shinella sp. BYT-45]|uniref:SCO family protein n=1 Tax=Shinella sp. BYT-45 TaxID=3377377 RepID=UPI0039813690